MVLLQTIAVILFLLAAAVLFILAGTMASFTFYLWGLICLVAALLIVLAVT